MEIMAEAFVLALSLVGTAFTCQLTWEIRNERRKKKGGLN